MKLLLHLMGHLNYSYNTIKVLPGSGEHNKAYNESNAVLLDNAGLHSFFKMSNLTFPFPRFLSLDSLFDFFLGNYSKTHFYMPLL